MGGGGEVRASLTGEVIEGMTPTPRNMPPPGTMPVGPRPPVGGRPGPGARPATRQSRQEEDDEVLGRQKAGPMAAIVLVLLVVGGVISGWWFWQQKRAPVIAVDKVFSAYKSKDWKSLKKNAKIPDDKREIMTKNNFGKFMDHLPAVFTLKN